MESAKKVLTDGGIYAEVSEDKFEGVPIQEYNVPARFRLNIFPNDLNRAAKFLAGKLGRKS